MARFMTRILVEYLGSPQSRGLAKRWECDGAVLRKDSLAGRVPCTSTGLVSGSLLYRHPIGNYVVVNIPETNTLQVFDGWVMTQVHRAENGNCHLEGTTIPMLACART